MSEKLFKHREKIKKLVRNKKKGKAFAERIGVPFSDLRKHKSYVKADLKNASENPNEEVFTNHKEFRYYRKLHSIKEYDKKPVFKDVFKDRESEDIVEKFKKHQLKKVKQHANMPNTKKLSVQEETFVNYYIALRNASQAAVRASYQNKNYGSVLLKRPEIQKEVADRLAGSFKAAEVSPEEVIADIKAIRDRAMQAVPVTDSEGEFLGEWQYDSRAALKAVELMGKYIKMFNDGVQVNMPGSEKDKEYRYDFSDLTDEELKEFQRIKSKIHVVEVFKKGELNA